MIENRVRRYASFLLATTTFIVVPCLGEAWAKDDAPPAASAGETAKKKNTARDASAQAIQLDTINVQSKKRTRKRTVAARTPAAPPPLTPPVIATNAGGDIGYHATEDRMHIHDWHATILKLLCKEGFLQLVAKAGGKSSGKAAEYRVVAGVG